MWVYFCCCCVLVCRSVMITNGNDANAPQVCWAYMGKYIDFPPVIKLSIV